METLKELPFETNVQFITRMRQGRKTFREIAEMMGVTKQRVYQILHGYNPGKSTRKKIVELLGGKCVRCGFSDPRALQIDHINGGGNGQLKKLGCGRMYSLMFRAVKSGINSEYQLLCANCNWIKRSENREVSKHTHKLGNFENISKTHREFLIQTGRIIA